MKGSPVATFCTLAESINFINMMNTQLYLCSAALLLTAAQTKAADKQKERPNILWLTFEDTSSYEFGCYGNAQ